MKQLEAVYLANVILYIESIETIIKVIQVNKKSQEATKMIRYYNKRKLKESDSCDDYFCLTFVKNLFEIFPNIETINCRERDIKNNLELVDKVKQIEINGFFPNITELEQEVKDKVIKLDIFCESLKSVRLNEFPNVRKVKIEYLRDGYLSDFLGDPSIKLNQLIVQTKDKKELTCLKNYSNIENKIIKLRNKLTKERYLELNQFSIVLSRYPIDGIDNKYSIGKFNELYLSNSYDINRIYDLTLFSKCCIETDCDLKKCELLEELNAFYIERVVSKIQINGLNHLKIIKNITNLDCIPPSVTYLSFDQEFNYKELLENNSNCFNNIKEVKAIINKTTYFDDTLIFMNFCNCTKLELINYGNFEKCYEYPITIKNFIINDFGDNKQFEGISKLTELRKLTIHPGIRSNFQKIQDIYNDLKELEWLKMKYNETIILPSTLTYLDLEIDSNADLRQYSNLKELRLTCYSSFLYKIQLPNKLSKLSISGKIGITNSNEIEVDRIIFYNTPSQHYKWKTNNIFIENECTKTI